MWTKIIFFALLCYNIGAFAKSVGEEPANDDAPVDLNSEGRAEEEQKPPRPGFPLFSLPQLPQLQIPSLSSLTEQFNLPQLPTFEGLGLTNPFPAPETVKATKTEYVEVTRRQTVHPVCYTAYAVKAPCLPYRRKDQEKNEDSPASYLELHTVNHVHESYDIYGDEDVISEQTIRPTSAVRVAPTSLYAPAPPVEIEDSRSGKYLKFGGDKIDKVKESEVKDEVRLEGSESERSETTTSAPSPSRFPFGVRPRQTTEYVTKTVLITKLEKFTDHRVTATMVAHNCLPVDPSIPRCRGFVNSIYDLPLVPGYHKGVEGDKKGTSNVHFEDDTQSVEKATTVEKIEPAPIVEEADPEVREEAVMLEE